MNKDECILAFDRTHDAVLAEQVLLETGIKVRVMPLPAAIRAGCGICLRITPTAYRDALRVLNACSVTLPKSYRRIIEQGKSRYTQYVKEGDHEST